MCLTIFAQSWTAYAVWRPHVGIRTHHACRVNTQLIDTGDASYGMFDEAQDEIYTLMENDNFARFKKSELFDQLMASVNPYTGDAVRRAGSSSAMRRSTAGRRVRLLAPCCHAAGAC